MKAMNCDEWFEKLYNYLDKDLEGDTLKEFEFHLKNCRPCWGRAEFEQKLKERIRSSCSIERCTDALRKRIQTILDKF